MARLRAREFDLWFGIRVVNEILEARNGPKTDKCFSRSWAKCFLLVRQMLRGNAVKIHHNPNVFLVRGQMVFLPYEGTRSWPGPGRLTTNRIRVP